MKKKFFVLLSFIFLLVGGYVYADNRGFVPEQLSSLTEKAQETSLDKIQEITKETPVINSLQNDLQENTTDQLSTLSSRAKEVSEYAQNAFNSGVKVDKENQAPLHERAIEYGQYVYCKQVVEDFEKNQSEEKVEPTKTVE
ncbi:MAG: hypothetical protein HN981_02855 [Candidatus Pacebacteria bacterium]|jgi:hypothetical protein|nr:hypothetical protein [Candidatus Paceibacterota bacterium]MBT4652569.1 hypothetical protein [Candidatus Paceibacterota bacterium]MBT6756396.1 hypothetical protein [Candidatus Paceibacterota bacterium]MBT6921310.1 hypothetical protein [Candidatus Paceibacterota bacterium]